MTPQSKEPTPRMNMSKLFNAEHGRNLQVLDMGTEAAAGAGAGRI